jgi:hypothetical protein
MREIAAVPIHCSDLGGFPVAAGTFSLGLCIIGTRKTAHYVSTRCSALFPTIVIGPPANSVFCRHVRIKTAVHMLLAYLLCCNVFDCTQFYIVGT